MWKFVVAVILIVGGAVLGLYLGFYVMFFKGVVLIIDGVKNNFDAVGIAWGILRIMIAGFVGWVSFICCFLAAKFFIEGQS